jgi:hypothetical protein
MTRRCRLRWVDRYEALNPPVLKWWFHTDYSRRVPDMLIPGMWSRSSVLNWYGKWYVVFAFALTYGSLFLMRDFLGNSPGWVRALIVLGVMFGACLIVSEPEQGCSQHGNIDGYVNVTHYYSHFSSRFTSCVLD